MEERLHIKYRVFREPETVFEEAHPVPMIPLYVSKMGSMLQAEEVDDFVFVLRPGTDRHAVVALMAYAASVKGENPGLAGDLFGVLAEEFVDVEPLWMEPYGG